MNKKIVEKIFPGTIKKIEYNPVKCYAERAEVRKR